MPKQRPNFNREAAIQAAIVEYVRTVAPQVLIWHVPNGGLRAKSEAARLKWVGVLAGVPDLTLALPGARVAFWEVKIPGQYLSSDQVKVVERLKWMGHSCAIVRGIDDARRELARLGIKTREAA